jgi:hypothetical protein
MDIGTTIQILGGNAVVIAVAGYLFKRLVEQRLAANLEKMKSELERTQALFALRYGRLADTIPELVYVFSRMHGLAIAIRLEPEKRKYLNVYSKLRSSAHELLIKSTVFLEQDLLTEGEKFLERVDNICGPLLGFSSDFDFSRPNAETFLQQKDAELRELGGVYNRLITRLRATFARSN